MNDYIAKLKNDLLLFVDALIDKYKKTQQGTVIHYYDSKTCK